jgi:SanA protein
MGLNREAVTPKFWIGLAFSLLLTGSGMLLLSYSWVAGAANLRLYDSVTSIPRSQAGLLLGTSKYVRSGQRNLFFLYRIDAAVELFEARKIDYILVSGDNSTHRYNEPRSMKEALLERGIPPERIVLDFAGFRTLDSVIRARKVFGQRKLTVISQRFHNERAILIGLHYGIDMVGFNARDVYAGNGYLTYLREVPARALVLMDLFFLKRSPRFLGKPISIPPVETSDKINPGWKGLVQ